MADSWSLLGLAGSGIYAYANGEIPVWNDTLKRFEPGSGSPGSGITELTGDVTAGPGSGSQAATLAASGVAAGTYGDASNVAQITVDAKGRVTSAVDVPITAGTGDVVGPGSAVDDHIATFDGATGKLIQDGGVTIADVIDAAVAAAVAAIGMSPIICYVNEGAVPSTGFKAEVYIPVACTITAVTLYADQDGDIEFDIFLSTRAGYTGAGSGSSIVAAAPPTLSGAAVSQDTTLTGWTTSIPADSILSFEVTGTPADLTRVGLALTRTP